MWLPEIYYQERGNTFSKVLITNNNDNIRVTTKQLLLKKLKLLLKKQLRKNPIYSYLRGKKTIDVEVVEVSPLISVFPQYLQSQGPQFKSFNIKKCDYLK